MADYFRGALKGLELRSKNNTLIFSDVLSDRLDALVATMIDHPLSLWDYSKTLELYYTKYRKNTNQEGMVFCVLRYQYLLEEQKSKKKKQTYEYLEFTGSHQGMDAMMEGHPDYMGMIQYDFKRLSILLDLCVSFVMLGSGVLWLKLPFWYCFGFVLCFYLLVWFVLWNFGAKRMVEKQLDKLAGFLDPLHANLDRSAMTKRNRERRN